MGKKCGDTPSARLIDFFLFQVYVKFPLYGQYLCQTCLKTIIQDSRKSEPSLVTRFNSEVNVIRSFVNDYEIPVICLEALQMALDGHMIAVITYLLS